MCAQRPANRSSGRRAGSRSPSASPTGLRYPIPASSVRAFNTRNQNQPQNPGLIFERFAPDWSDRATLKKDGLEAVRTAAEKADRALLQAWNARWAACAQAAHAEPFSLKTDWRFIAGLGRKGSLEVGFTFHRYGFPILPGSSVKGIARAWALMKIAQRVTSPSLKELDDILSADGDQASEERKRYERWKTQQTAEVQGEADDFRAVFGTRVAAGRAVFFDAIPAGVPRLELDVMNPHFPQYYQGAAPPADWQSPVPVYFLTVAPDTEFRFAVGWRGPLDGEGGRLRDQAKEWLIGGLTELGAGAKTSAGYGYFIASVQPALSAHGVGQLAQTVELAQPTAAGAPIAPTPVPPTPSTPAEELVWRTGTVREYRPDWGRGRLVDDETGEELGFDRDAIPEKGWSPGRKHRVRYAVVEREGHWVVVRLQRGS